MDTCRPMLSFQQVCSPLLENGATHSGRVASPQLTYLRQSPTNEPTGPTYPRLIHTETPFLSR